MPGTGTINTLRALNLYDQGELWLTDLDGDPTGELLALVETWMGTPASLVDLLSSAVRTRPTVRRIDGGLFGDIVHVRFSADDGVVLEVLQRTHAWALWGTIVNGQCALEVPAALWGSTELGMVGVLSPADLSHATCESHGECLWRRLLHDQQQRRAEADALGALIALAGNDEEPISDGVDETVARQAQSL